MSNHSFQVEYMTALTDMVISSCDDQHQTVTTDTCPLPNWWKRIKAIQVLEENKD